MGHSSCPANNVGQGIQECTKQIFLEALGRPDHITSNFLKAHFKFFKGCFPQVLLGPFWNTLT